MDMKTRYVWWLMLAGLLVAALRMVIAHDAAGQVVRHPDPTRSLAERWDWAFEEAIRQNTDVWIGYSIERMMRPNSNLMIGSNMSFHNGHMKSDGPTLADRLAGRAAMPVPPDDEAVRREAQRWINGDDEGREDGPRVPKDIAIVFRYAPNTTRPDVYQSMIIGNVDLDLDLEGQPLLWLGSAEDEESLNWLAQRYRAATTEKQKERLIAAQGVHDAPRQVVPLLQSILQSNEGEEVREAAAHWLGWQHDPAAVRLLDETAHNDRSDEVR